VTVDLQLQDPLTQVVFVNDYLQLVFQDCTFTLYSLTTLAHEGRSLRQGSPGFCDALVSLIGQGARVEQPTSLLLICFSGGASIAVPCSGPDIRGPEAWQFARSGSPAIVQQVA